LCSLVEACTKVIWEERERVQEGGIAAVFEHSRP
jgi:hypothetical protein